MESRLRCYLQHFVHMDPLFGAARAAGGAAPRGRAAARLALARGVLGVLLARREARRGDDGARREVHGRHVQSVKIQR